MKEDKNIDELFKKIDDVDLISNEQLDKMNFYDLCYYMQTLNLIDSLSSNEVGE